VSKFILLVILIMPGQEPKIQQAEMPDLDHCLAAVQGFMTSPKARAAIANGGVRQAACGEIIPPGSPT
jgi:hypothetical protein